MKDKYIEDIREIVTKTDKGTKLTQAESERITNFINNPARSGDDLLFLMHANKLLHEDGFLSKGEINQARRAFYQGVRGYFGPAEDLDKANPDAAKLATEYFKNYKAVKEDVPVLEPLGKSEKGNAEIAERNKQKTEAYQQRVSDALFPGVISPALTKMQELGEVKRDAVLDKYLNDTHQIKIIDDGRPSGNMDNKPPPVAATPDPKIAPALPPH